MTPCNKLPACGNCKFSSPSVAYPMIRCNMLGGFMAPQFKCQWFDRKSAK
jgi:hypothetical protein